MVKPKKKRIIIIVILILGRVADDLTNNTTTGLNFDMASAIKQADAMMDAVDEDGPGWTSDHQDVYVAADAIGQCFESAGEPDYETALSDLNEALGKL